MSLFRFTAILCRDTDGQDLIEYALMAGLIALSSAALMPAIVSSIGTVFSSVVSVMASAGS